VDFTFQLKKELTNVWCLPCCLSGFMTKRCKLAIFTVCTGSYVVDILIPSHVLLSPYHRSGPCDGRKTWDCHIINWQPVIEAMHPFIYSLGTCLWALRWIMCNMWDTFCALNILSRFLIKMQIFRQRNIRQNCVPCSRAVNWQLIRVLVEMILLLQSLDWYRCCTYKQ